MQHQRRANNFHRPKKQFLGPIHSVPPAWRPANNPNQYAEGSKILLSSLPADVQEGDVEVIPFMCSHMVCASDTNVIPQDLLKKTVGPLKDVFLIYNSQGKSKGMAVVTFQRPGDAAVACTKYDGKIVDGSQYLLPTLLPFLFESSYLYRETTAHRDRRQSRSPETTRLRRA